MVSSRWKIRMSLLSLALLAAFTPLAYSADGGIARSTAQCETCCPQADASCIVCGSRSCIKVDNAYEGRVGGPCSPLQP